METTAAQTHSKTASQTHSNAHSQTQNRMSLTVPGELSVVGIVAGKWATMQSESIGSDALFLRCKEYVRPRSVMEIIIWISNEEAPLHALVTASFIERTWRGYGVAVQISAMPEVDRERWNHYLHTAAAISSPSYRSISGLGKQPVSYHIMTVGYVLPAAVVDILEQQGVSVENVRTPEQALKQARRGEGNLVVAALGGGTYDGLEICRQLGHMETAPMSALITNRGVLQDFESGLYASATKVIARPCSFNMLAERLLDLLRSGRQQDEDCDESNLTDCDDEMELPAVAVSAPGAHSPTLMRQVSQQMSSWWMSARTFFQSSTFQRLSHFTVS